MADDKQGELFPEPKEITKMNYFHSGVENPDKPLTFAEGRDVLGVSALFQNNATVREDEILREFIGIRGTQLLREMRDNDPIIGGICSAFENLIRSSKMEILPADLGEEATEADKATAMKYKEFAEDLLNDMDDDKDDFITQSSNHLWFGFMLHEIILKRRDDGYIGIKTLAPRAPWTIDQFEEDENGRIIAARQITNGYRIRAQQSNYWLPMRKLVHFKTPTANYDPSGRSIIRNAYTSYYHATHLQRIEAIAIERELNGIPMFKIPNEVLGSTDEKDKSLVRYVNKIGEAVTKGEVKVVVIPSDPFKNNMQDQSSVPQVTFELVASNGTRSIDVSAAIQRYQTNMAQSVLADFLTLGHGSSSGGSYAMASDKSSLFLRSVQNAAANIAETIQKQVFEPLFKLNGMPEEYIPKVEFGNLAPAKLDELGQFVNDLASVGLDIHSVEGLAENLLNQADLPSEVTPMEERDPEMMMNPRNPGNQERNEDPRTDTGRADEEG